MRLKVEDVFARTSIFKVRALRVRNAPPSLTRAISITLVCIDPVFCPSQAAQSSISYERKQERIDHC